MIHETALGLTLMILFVIAGNEIAYLVHPGAALLALAAAVGAGGIAYEWGS